ncbi:MAG: glycosyltransferase family 2 protein, partial [Anaerohalosphaeraceae bacterium]
IASLQRRNGKFYRILSVYDETTGSTRDVDADPQPLTEDIAILGEGKPGNQMSALSFARGEGLFTFDMNQDFSPEQVMKIPILLQELDDPDVGIVDYPEVIDSDRLSKVGAVHAVFDRTFSASQKEHMHMMGSLFHYGHPSLWRTAAAKSVGGVSSTTHVNEDIIGGEAVAARGWKIVNRQYIEAIKLREISLQGFEGINRKYGMGGTQQALCRQMKRTMSFLSWGGAMSHYFTGPGFYIKQSVVVPTLFLYALSVMFLGISLFAAVPSAALAAAAGLFAMGQAIVLKAYLLCVMEDGFIAGSKGFFKLWFYMAPIAMWNGASEFFGSFLPIVGVAKYVATSRGFNLHHMRMDRFIEAYGEKAIVPGATGTAIAVVSIALWANATLVLSAPFIVMFLSMMIVPFALIQGAFIRDGISHRTVSHLFATDFVSMKKLFADNFRFVKANRQYCRLFREIPIYAIASVVWLLLLGPSAFRSYVRAEFQTDDAHDRIVQ